MPTLFFARPSGAPNNTRKQTHGRRGTLRAVKIRAYVEFKRGAIHASTEEDVDVTLAERSAEEAGAVHHGHPWYCVVCWIGTSIRAGAQLGRPNDDGSFKARH